MQTLSPRSDPSLNVSSGLSLWVPSTGQAKSREDIFSALSTVASVGAQVAPQRCPILRTRSNIVPGLATLKNCQRRSRNFFIPVQRTFWIPDSQTFYFLVDNTPCQKCNLGNTFILVCINRMHWRRSAGISGYRAAGGYTGASSDKHARPDSHANTDHKGSISNPQLCSDCVRRGGGRSL